MLSASEFADDSGVVLSKAYSQVVAGVKYYLTLEVRGEDDLCMERYEVVVWEKLPHQGGGYDIIKETRIPCESTNEE